MIRGCCQRTAGIKEEARVYECHYVRAPICKQQITEGSAKRSPLEFVVHRRVSLLFSESEDVKRQEKGMCRPERNYKLIVADACRQQISCYLSTELVQSNTSKEEITKFKRAESSHRNGAAKE